MSVFGQLASLMIRPEKDAGFEDTFASRFGAAPLSAEEAAAMRLQRGNIRQQGEGAPRAERVMGGLADLSKSLGEPVTRITDYSRSRIGTEAPVTEEDVFRQDLASRNIGKGVAQAGAYGLPIRNPLGKVPSQAELRGGQLLAETPKAPPAVVQGIRAYHGSPHDFDRFDLSKIGTGEGAQAYGHGLYFAENEGVARGYRDQLARNTYKTDAGLFDPYSRANQAGLEHVNVRVSAGKGIDEGIARAKELLEKQPFNAEMLNRDLAKLIAARDAGAAPNPGRMYEVSLNARPEQFLDWDRPLREQPIYDAVRKTSPNELPNMPDVATGAQVYDALKNRAMSRLDPSERQMPRAYQPHAAEALREAGIPGIRYLDQGSRVMGDAAKIIEKYGSREKALDVAQERLANAHYSDRKYWQNVVDQMGKSETSNYVVFDPGIIDILRKYGLAGAGATGLGTLAAQDNYRSN